MAETGDSMSEHRPILAFASSSKGSIPSGAPQFVPPPHHPSPSRQGERLRPQFSTLKSAFESGRAAATRESTESDPELVIVFDVVGHVDRFVRAVSGVEGLEFLAEVLDEDHSPDLSLIHI